MTRGETADPLVRAAAAWRARIDAGALTPAEEAEFERWLEADAGHAAAYREMDATWSVLDRAREVSPAALGLPPAAPRPNPRRWLAPLAAAAAVALAATLWLRPDSGPAEPAAAPSVLTAADTFKRLDLPDGSVARLNAGSALVVDFLPGERRVRLLRGEAHFTVTKDAARPFIVETRGVLARAVGTAFTVSSRADAVEVCVTEGRVRVEPRDLSSAFAAVPELTVGDRVTVRAPDTAAPVVAPVVRLSPSDLAATLAWQQRTLAFDAAPLAEIVAEFNRFNQHRLVIDDAALARRSFGGSFRADDPEGFIALVAATSDIVVERRAGRTHLRFAR